MADFAYHIEVECSPGDIKFLSYTVRRDIVSLFCVFSDLLMTFLLYISLICLKNFQDLTKEDV